MTYVIKSCQVTSELQSLRWHISLMVAVEVAVKRR